MVLDKVKEIISKEIDVEVSEIKAESTFESLGADSLDLFQVVNDLEEEFDIRIEETDNIKTVGDIVSYVEKKIKEKEEGIQK